MAAYTAAHMAAHTAVYTAVCMAVYSLRLRLSLQVGSGVYLCSMVTFLMSIKLFSIDV